MCIFKRKFKSRHMYSYIAKQNIGNKTSFEHNHSKHAENIKNVRDSPFNEDTIHNKSFKHEKNLQYELSLQHGDDKDILENTKSVEKIQDNTYYKIKII